MSELLETINSISAFLWSIVGIIGAVILLWGLWQIAQIVRNMKEYGLDFIGFMRGELHFIAKKNKLEIMKPSQKTRRIHTILWQGKDDLANAYKKTGEKP
jgi:hypothetical protein